MALSKNFFGLRQGSTRSLTFQVDHGVQVTKERVTDVSNPQTRAQMEQRMKAVMVANARARLKGIINHSFEGVRYGEDSLREFSRLNMRKNALHVNSWVPKGINDCGVADFIVSNGSLPDPAAEAFVDRTIDYSVWFLVLNNIRAITAEQYNEALSQTDGETTVRVLLDKLLENNKGTLQLNDQLTFLFLGAGESIYPEDIPSYDDEAKYLYRTYHSFLVRRVILNYEHLATFNINNDIVLTDGYICMIIVKSIPNIDSVIVFPNNLHFQGGTAILSRKEGDNWLRSPATLNCMTNVNLGWTFDEAMATYLKPGRTSPKYLNSGIDGVDITGGK